MRNVAIQLESEMPFLMHADNIDWADLMEEWKNDPMNKVLSKAGDDRTPPWRWIGSLHCDDPEKGYIAVPSEYVMSCFMDGAAKVPTGKGRETFKAQSQSGIVPQDFYWTFLNNGKQIPMSAIQKFKAFKTFKEHQEAARDLGFSLFVKRVKIGKAKHIRVRPRFERWSVAGNLIIVDDQITDKVLGNIIDIAGRLKGLGDWRPGAPESPGPFGTFKGKIGK